MKIFLPVDVLNEQCEKCRNFEIDQDTTWFYGNSDVVATEHYLYCKNLRLCQKLLEDLKKEEK